MTAKAPAWLLLVTNLPGHNPTLRMRIWRALKAAGAGLLRDGAYLLPNSDHAKISPSAEIVLRAFSCSRPGHCTRMMK